MIVLVLAAAALAPPTYLVERLAPLPGGSERVTVFRDREAVLAQRVGEGEPVVRRVRLEAGEYDVIRQVVEECYGELAKDQGPAGALGGALTEVRLAPPDRTPIVVRLAATAVRSLAAGRLERALDELQRRILATPPGAEDFSQWEPVVGEKVLLVDGREGNVAAVLRTAGGDLLIQLNLGPASEYHTVDELRRLVIKRLP